MAWNIFKKKDNNPNDDRFKEMSAKLQKSLTKVQNRKREVSKKIDELEDWSAQVIIETYPDEFPNGNMTFYRDQYKEKALREYEDIKTKYAETADKDKIQRCEKVIKGYSNHLKLRKSELELYEKLEKKYSAALDEFKSMKIGQQGMTLMGQHEARLRELNDGADAYVEAMSEQEKYKSLNDALEHEVTYVQQLEELSTKFDQEDGGDIDHTQAFKEELEKITKEL